jgi:hypothetical protein
MIFDGARMPHATSYIKSLRHFAGAQQRIAGHLVVPAELLPPLLEMK